MTIEYNTAVFWGWLNFSSVKTTKPLSITQLDSALRKASRKRYILILWAACFYLSSIKMVRLNVSEKPKSTQV